MVKERNLLGNDWRSLKSWSCIAVEKSRVKYWSFGQRLEISWRIFWKNLKKNF